MKKVLKLYTILVTLTLLVACNNTNEKADQLIGTWQLADYKDNVQRTPEELKAFQQQVQALKRMILVVNSDKSYSRSAGQQFEVGNWSVDEQVTTFTTKPKNQQATSLNIKYLDAKEVVFTLAEGQVVTELTFVKQ